MAKDPLAQMPPAIRAQLREMFFDEAATLVDQLEKALLTLEQTPEAAETINDAFRAAHTIKGSAAGVGLEEISTFTHELEYALDAVRAQRCALRLPGITLLLEGVDHLRQQLSAAQAGTPIDPGDAFGARLAKEFPRAPINGNGHKKTPQAQNPLKPRLKCHAMRSLRPAVPVAGLQKSRIFSAPNCWRAPTSGTLGGHSPRKPLRWVLIRCPS
jgi:chemotaxis protein histidine kinase CheA